MQKHDVYSWASETLGKLRGRGVATLINVYLKLRGGVYMYNKIIFDVDLDLMKSHFDYFAYIQVHVQEHV